MIKAENHKKPKNLRLARRMGGSAFARQGVFPKIFFSGGRYFGYTSLAHLCINSKIEYSDTVWSHSIFELMLSVRYANFKNFQNGDTKEAPKLDVIEMIELNNRITF